MVLNECNRLFCKNKKKSVFGACLFVFDELHSKGRRGLELRREARGRGVGAQEWAWMDFWWNISTVFFNAAIMTHDFLLINFFINLPKKLLGPWFSWIGWPGSWPIGKTFLSNVGKSCSYKAVLFGNPVDTKSCLAWSDCNGLLSDVGIHSSSLLLWGPAKRSAQWIPTLIENFCLDILLSCDLSLSTSRRFTINQIPK